MNTHEHRAMREQLGALALGHLEAAESLAVQAHLDGCDACRAELEDIALLATPLGEVDPTHLLSEPTPPPHLVDDIARRVRAEERRRPYWSPGRPAAAVAACAAAAACFAFGFAVAPDPPPPLPLESVAVEERVTGLHVTANVIAHTWGMEVQLVGRGFDEGEAYRAIVTDEQGREIGAGRFTGTGQETMRCNLNTSVLRADATSFRVVQADEPTVVLIESNLNHPPALPR